MAGIAVNRLTNANVYVDGNSFLGKVESIDLPTIKQIMTEHKALGMVGKVSFASGIEKMEAKISWNAFYVDAMKKAANPTQTVQMQVRASLETWDSSGRSAQVPATAFITAQFTDFPGGNFKQHDNVELTSMLNVTQYRLEIDGQQIVEFDALSNIYKVNGVDILADYRANIGG